MYDIIELHRMLQEARGEDPDRKIKARIAKTQQRREDIKLLSKYSNLCTAGIADTLNIPVAVVAAERARIELESQNKLKRELDVLTGHLDPYEGASVAIFK